MDNGGVIPPPVGKTDVTVDDLGTYDATGDDFNFILDFSSATQIFAANINGFDTGDIVTITNAPANADIGTLYGSSSATSIDFFYGNTTLFMPSWTVQFGDQDAAVVTDLVNGATVDDQQATLDAAWGDWLFIA